MNLVVTKDMIISDVIKLDKGTVPILMEHGLHCLGCPSATGESLAVACEIHGIDVDALLSALNEYLATL